MLLGPLCSAASCKLCCCSPPAAKLPVLTSCLPHCCQATPACHAHLRTFALESDSPLDSIFLRAVTFLTSPLPTYSALKDSFCVLICLHHRRNRLPGQRPPAFYPGRARNSNFCTLDGLRSLRSPVGLEMPRLRGPLLLVKHAPQFYVVPLRSKLRLRPAHLLPNMYRRHPGFRRF